MNGLSEAERDALSAALSSDGCWDGEDCCYDSLAAALPAIEAIVAARLASVEALADEWERVPGTSQRAFQTCAADLRAVLGSDAHTEREPVCAVPRRYFVQQTCELPAGHAGDHEDTTHLWENDAHTEQKGTS